MLPAAERRQGWHPRDVDTVLDHFDDQASEANLAKLREHVNQSRG